MTSVQYLQDDFILNGTSSKVVIEALQKANFDDYKIIDIVGNWFVGAIGSKDPASFKFVTVVEGADATCTPTYRRGFAHTDWVDGENRVQAGMTPEELGFNARFHSIENEFDAIAQQFTRLGACAAEIRADLSGVVKELESKITMLQNQIHAQQQKEPKASGPAILGTVDLGGKTQFVTQFGNDFKFVEFATTPIKTVVKPPPPIEYVPLHFTEPDFRKLVPLVTDGVGQPDVLTLFESGTPVTVVELRRRFSDVTVKNGVTLGAMLASLPNDATFATPADVVAEIVGSALAEAPPATVADVRTEALGDARDRTGAAVLNTGVRSIVADTAVADALIASGFKTVGSLAGASRIDVVNALESHGIAIDSAVVDGAITSAVLGRAVRNLGAH